MNFPEFEGRMHEGLFWRNKFIMNNTFATTEVDQLNFDMHVFQSQTFDFHIGGVTVLFSCHDQSLFSPEFH